MADGHYRTLAAAKWSDPAEIADRYKFNPSTDFWLGRHPQDYDTMLGVKDDGHVFLCAETRQGKGRSIVINNLLNWRGSIVSVDPKGENASICAARRAEGDGKHCTEGLGQKTYVLDPYGLSQKTEAYRASCNIMDVLDANSGSLLNDCRRVAEAMRMTEPGGESESWSKAGADITALIIAHVKTHPAYDGQRHLVTVRELITSGIIGVVEFIERRNTAEVEAARAEGRDPKLQRVPSGFEVLFSEMKDNKAARGKIAARARSLEELMKNNVRQWGSLLQNATTETSFIDDEEMEEQLAQPLIETSHNGRIFNLEDLKVDEDGISIFICLPDDPTHPAIRWQKALITLIFMTMRRDQREPATKKQVLMCLDEFAAMGEMKAVSHGLTSIAGAGVKLFIIVTNLAQLRQHYGEAWTMIPGGCALQLWFAPKEKMTREYIQNDFGEAEVTFYTRSGSTSRGKTHGTSESKTRTQGGNTSQTDSVGSSQSTNYSKAHTESENTSSAKTKSHNLSMGISDARSWNNSRTSGQSDTEGSGSSWSFNQSKTRGKNRSHSHNDGIAETYEGTGMFDLFPQSTNRSRGGGKNSGTSSSNTAGSSRGGSTNRSRTLNMSETRGFGGSQTSTRTEGTGTSETETVGYGSSDTETHSVGSSSTASKAYARGRSWSEAATAGSNASSSETFVEGWQEHRQKRPLITIPEMNTWLKVIHEREDPAYPGFALIQFSDDVFLVRKSYYDEDPFFEGRFTPHYRYADKFVPRSQQRLLGCQYTAQHFLPIRLPSELLTINEDVDVTVKVGADRWFETRDTLFEWKGPTFEANVHRLMKSKVIDGLEADAVVDNLDEPPQEKARSIEEKLGPARKELLPAKIFSEGKVIEVAGPDEYDQKGEIMLLRMERPYTDDDRANLETYMFHSLLAYLEERGIAQDVLDKHIEGLNARYQNLWEDFKERKRQEAEAARRAAEKAERLRIQREKERKEEEARRAKEKLDKEIADERTRINTRYGYVVSFFFIVIPTLFISFFALQSLLPDFSAGTKKFYQTSVTLEPGDPAPKFADRPFQNKKVFDCQKDPIIPYATATPNPGKVFCLYPHTKYDYPRNSIVLLFLALGLSALLFFPFTYFYKKRLIAASSHMKGEDHQKAIWRALKNPFGSFFEQDRRIGLAAVFTMPTLLLIYQLKTMLSLETILATGQPWP